MEVTFSDLMVLVGIVAAIYVYYQANQNFPAKETAELIRELAILSKKTPTTIDDELVRIAELINKIRMEAEVLPIEPDNQG